MAVPTTAPATRVFLIFPPFAGFVTLAVEVEKVLESWTTFRAGLYKGR